MYSYVIQNATVVDGDTLHVELDLGLDVSIKTTIRLYGIDCPEHGTPEGDAATAFTKAWVDAHKGGLLEVDTVKDKREKYGRYLGTIFCDGVPGSLNAALVDAGHAKPYSGGKRG